MKKVIMMTAMLLVAIACSDKHLFAARVPPSVGAFVFNGTGALI